jgi:hypothetical protein
MLMMAAVPSGLYFAEGLVITSIFSMASAGICSSDIARLALFMRFDGLPLTSTSTFSLPRRLTLPSMSTCTDGMFSSRPVAAPVALMMSLPTV